MSITKYLNLSHLRKLLSALGQRFYAIEQRQDNFEHRQDNFDTQIRNINVETDTTLSVSGKPADAAEVGSEFRYVVDRLIPTKVSDLNNDSGFQTQAQVNALIAAAGDDDTTYAISMSGNVITLTGSDGNSSTVTLPVYTGGVV